MKIQVWDYRKVLTKCIYSWNKIIGFVKPGRDTFPGFNRMYGHLWNFYIEVENHGFAFIFLPTLDKSGKSDTLIA